LSLADREGMSLEYKHKQLVLKRIISLSMEASTIQEALEHGTGN